MKEFNWDYAAKTHTKEKLYLMEKYCGRKMSEDEWVNLVGALPKKGLHNSQTRSPSSAKSEYRNLKKKFNFFT